MYFHDGYCFYKYIVLSFAPSAAAVWHCHRVSITSQSEAVRHYIFSSVGHYKMRMAHSTWTLVTTAALSNLESGAQSEMFESKTECWPFLGTVPPLFSPKIFKKTRRNARLCCMKKWGFRVPNDLKRHPPEAIWATWGPLWIQAVFQDPLGRHFAPF